MYFFIHLHKMAFYTLTSESNKVLISIERLKIMEHRRKNPIEQLLKALI